MPNKDITPKTEKTDEKDSSLNAEQKIAKEEGTIQEEEDKQEDLLNAALEMDQEDELDTLIGDILNADIGDILNAELEKDEEDKSDVPVEDKKAQDLLKLKREDEKD